MPSKPDKRKRAEYMRRYRAWQRAQEAGGRQADLIGGADSAPPARSMAQAVADLGGREDERPPE